MFLQNVCRRVATTSLRRTPVAVMPTAALRRVAPFSTYNSAVANLTPQQEEVRILSIIERDGN